MSEVEDDTKYLEKLKELIKEGKIDSAVRAIAVYFNLSTEKNYIERIEGVLETVSPLHAGRLVIRSLFEQSIINIPILLKNLSKKDPVLKYSFLLLLKPICVNDSDLILPYSKELLDSEDPNVREAFLQLLIFIADGEKLVKNESLVELIASKLTDKNDFVIEKVIQTLKIIGNHSPALVTRILSNCIKDCYENVELKKNIDNILKSIVTVEKIEEITEKAETQKKEGTEKIPLKEESGGLLSSQELHKEGAQIKQKEMELKKKEVELIKKRIEIDEKTKEIELEKKAVQKEIKEEILSKTLTKEEQKILGKEVELKKVDLELKKMKIELEEKEKELEAKELEERKKGLTIKEELLQKEKELLQVELALKKKSLEERERKIIEEEKERKITEEKDKMKEYESKEQ